MQIWIFSQVQIIVLIPIANYRRNESANSRSNCKFQLQIFVQIRV